MQDPTYTFNLDGSGEYVSGVALNATAALRTLTFGRLDQKFARLKVQINFTRNAATTVTATITGSIDGTNYGSLMSSSTSSGAVSVYPMVHTFTTSSSGNFILDFDVRGLRKAKIVLDGASAGGSDLVTTSAVGVVGL